MKLRSNHVKGRRTARIPVRFMILVMLLILTLFVLFQTKIHRNIADLFETESGLAFFTDSSERYYLPEMDGLHTIHYRYFSLGYDRERKLARWAGYELSAEMLLAQSHIPTGRFQGDPQIPHSSEMPNKYSDMGYDLGSLVPASDMTFDSTAIREVFFISNAVPQNSRFKHGVWRELEEQIREWTSEKNQLIIVSGPVLTDTKNSIELEGIQMIYAFYKVVLALEETKKAALGIILPHRMVTENLTNYFFSVDSVEALTGINFFAELMPSNLEDRLESQVDLSFWPVNQERYILRINKWNKYGQE